MALQTLLERLELLIGFQLLGQQLPAGRVNLHPSVLKAERVRALGVSERDT